MKPEEAARLRSAGPPQASTAPSGGSTLHEVKSVGANHSLRARLLWFILVAILLAAVLQAVTAYRGALQQADAMFDDHLQQVARSMRSGAPLGGPFEESTDGDGFDLYVQIWGPDGRQLFRSSRSALPPRAVLGFSDVEANGNRYRVYSLQTPMQTVQIAQDLSARTARARALAAKAVLPFGLLTPLLMLAVWWVISRSLAPIERARKQVAQRAADDFSPLPNTDLPDEVRPLVDELNLLFGRVRGAFDAQKNFVADAAHELRSPLTALKLQAQALRKPDEDPAAREAGVARLNLGIDRAIRLVEQLLALARAEAAGTPTGSKAQAALQDVVKLAVADVLPHAQHRQVDLGVAGSLPDEPVQVSGQLEALRVLLRNLLDNAVKYTPVAGRVDVSLQLDGGQPLLRVEDSGPGIAEEERERVFDRFFRGSQTVASLNPGEEDQTKDLPATGSGLGLAIVQAIAAQHGATLQLGRSERLGGLQVDVRFPAGASGR